jgi:hypothetical protein
LANQVHHVYTNMNPEELTGIAAETFRRWLAFAQGKEAIGGRTLAHPSGRYAASISWKKTGVASVAIFADEKIAPEAQWIEEGRAGVDMKSVMLGKGNTKRSKDGYLYRAIPIRSDSFSPVFGPGAIRTTASGESIKKGVAKLWAEPRSTYSSDRLVTMSNRPGSASWKIPVFQPYAPAHILKTLLENKYGT